MRSLRSFISRRKGISCSSSFLVNGQSSYTKNLRKGTSIGIITQSTKRRLSELEELKSSLDIQISKQLIANNVKLTKEEIIYWLSQFKSSNIDDEKVQQKIVDTFINNIFVYEDKIIITYNYDGANNTSTIDLNAISTPLEVFDLACVGGGGGS